MTFSLLAICFAPLSIAKNFYMTCQNYYIGEIFVRICQGRPASRGGTFYCADTNPF